MRGALEELEEQFEKRVKVFAGRLGAVVDRQVGDVGGEAVLRGHLEAAGHDGDHVFVVLDRVGDFEAEPVPLISAPAYEA